MPTILDICGVDAPGEVDGVVQQPIDGASARSTFDHPHAPSPRSSQYFEVFGSRSMIQGKWKVTTDHVADYGKERELLVGSHDFSRDHWALFDLERDFSETHDVSETHPEVVKELQAQWEDEANRNHVLPLMDSIWERTKNLRRGPWPPPERMVFQPGGGLVVVDSLPLLAHGFRFTAEVDISADGASGILCALGDWHIGFCWYARDDRLFALLNPGGEPVRISATATLPRGQSMLECAYRPDDDGALLTLAQGSDVVGSTRLARPLTVRWHYAARQLTIGYDRGFPVDRTYEVPFAWTGRLNRVVLETRGPVLSDEDSTEGLHAVLGQE
jgi:arylsulfatase